MSKKKPVIKQDRLGKYQILNTGKGGMVTTIRYVLKCNVCGLTTGIIGSLTTRKRTLASSYFMCPFCGRNMKSD